MNVPGFLTAIQNAHHKDLVAHEKGRKFQAGWSLKLQLNSITPKIVALANLFMW